MTWAIGRGQGTGGVEVGAKVADPATEGGGGLRGVSALLRLDKKKEAGLWKEGLTSRTVAADCLTADI